MAVNCKFNITNANYRKVNAEVKEALGKDYKYDIFRSIADTFSGDINSLTAEYVLERYPRTTVEEETTFPTEEAEPAIKVYDGLWSRDEVAKPENQDKLFIFTDNTDRNSGTGLIRDDSKYAKKYGKGKHYPGTTSAVIRGLNNAFPVSTQRYYHLGAKRESGRWTNDDINEFKEVIKDEFDTIIEEWNTGNYTTIVLPNGGLLTETEITGLNDKERTLIKAALEEELKRLYDAVGAVYTDDISVQQKSNETQQKEAQREARLTAKKENANAAKWARFAGDEDNLEVSTAGDDFGKQFSALNAVFAEGTKITIRIGGKKTGKQQTFDIGGYSVEAAYQMIKGYTRNPKGPLTTKEGKPMRIQGKDKAPISELLYVETDRRTQASKQAIEDYTYIHAYLPLWKTWAKQNKDKIKELKKKAKGKILTDRFAKTRVSQARALSEILWGAPKIARSKAVQDRYDIQKENAVAAS